MTNKQVSLESKDCKSKHKWYDVIVAWAKGETIQLREYRELTKLEWYDFPIDYTPNFSNPTVEWRIKPNTVIKRYRMALVSTPKFNSAKNVISVDITNTSIDDPAEYNIQGFIRWVGDTVEVEVEV